MKQTLFFLTSFIGALSSVAAQTNVILYLNDQFELTTADRSTKKVEALMDIRELVFAGDFREYSEGGVLISEGSYLNGKKSGTSKVYNDNGKLRSVIEYPPESGFIIQELLNSNGQTIIMDGTGDFTIPYSYFENFYVLRKWLDGELTGQFKNGQRIGEWVYKGSDSKIVYQEIYENGQFIKRTGIVNGRSNDFQDRLEVSLMPNNNRIEELNFDQNAFPNLQQYFESYPPEGTDSIQRSITYPGGISKLISLINLNVNYPAADRRVMKQGKVIVSLTVSENGEVKNINVIKSVSPTLDKEALRVIKEFQNKLCPAMLNGKTYESILSIPIVFKLG